MKESADLGHLSLRDKGQRNLRLVLPESLRGRLDLGDRVTLALRIITVPNSRRGCRDPAVSQVRLPTRVVLVRSTPQHRAEQ